MTTDPKSQGCPKRTSVSVSQGSITVEAAMAVPLFFFAAVCFICLIEIMAIQVRVHNGMQYAIKKLSRDAYILPVVTPGSMEEEIVRAVGKDRLQRSIVVDGSSGISAVGSSYSTDHVIHMRVTYRVKLPFPVFGTHIGTYEDKMEAKAWTGYEGGGVSADRDDIVYVTESGLVYHRDYHCRYLDLSIETVPMGSVDGERNQDGAKYYPCESCGKAHTQGGMVYITGYGNRYHTSLACAGLKRTIYAIPLSEAVGKGACSKCGK